METGNYKTQDEDKQNKNATQYVLDTTVKKKCNFKLKMVAAQLPPILV